MAFGLAQSGRFLFENGELMIGPLGSSFSLASDTHSVGLIKGLQTNATKEFRDLTQDIDGQVVDSTNTMNNIEITGNLHEFTPRNLAWLAGLNALDTKFSVVNTVKSVTADIASAGTTLAMAANHGMAVGDLLIVVDRTKPNQPFITKATALASNNLTVSPAIPVAITVANALVYKATDIPLGRVLQTNYFSAKITSRLKDGGRPLVFVMPKVQVTSGVQISFGTEDYAALPITLKPIVCLPTDAEFSAYLSEDGARLAGRLLTP